MITPAREQNLKAIALESLRELVKSLCYFCDICNQVGKNFYLRITMKFLNKLINNFFYINYKYEMRF